MCDPLLVAVAAVGISAVQGVVQYQQGREAAKNQEKALLNDYANQTAQVQEQQYQVNAQAQQAQSERARQAQAERARLRVAAGEAGLAGALSGSLFRDTYMQEGMDLSTIEANRINTQQQSMREAESIRSQTQGRLNTIQRPSAVAAGLQIAGDAVSAYSNYQSQKLAIEKSKGY